MEPALPPHPPWTSFLPQPSSCPLCDSDHRVLSCCPSVLLLEPPWGQQPLPVREDLLPLTPAPTPCPYRGMLLSRGGVLDHRGAIRRVDSAEQVRGPGMGSVANTDPYPILILPAHSPVRGGLLQTQGQSLLPEGVGGAGGTEG